MSSKQTDYVNAQFDNAFLRIKALFDEINNGMSGAEVSTNFYAGDGYAVYILIYKKGNTVYLEAASLLNTGHGIGTGDAIQELYSWGVPPQRYVAEQKQIMSGKEYTRSFEVYPRQDQWGGVGWFVHNNGSDHFVGPAGPLVIRANWRA